MKKYFYGKQKISNSDINAVVRSLKSNVISQGPELKKLELNVSKYFGAKYCVAVSSGTAALHLSCLALNLKKPFYGLTSPITFAATVNAILLSGGSFNLIDINKDDFNLEPEKLEKFIEKKIRNNETLPKIVIPVHFAGLPVKMREIKKICDKHKISIIEDASQAMGSSYNKEKIGSCKYSDITVFSFHPVKSITSGEGGLILTNSKQIYQKLIMLRINGVKKNGSKSWEHDVKTVGLNYKISELNCALANSQLKNLNLFIKKREYIANYYLKNLNNKFFHFKKIIKILNQLFIYLYLFKKKISAKLKNKFYEKLKGMGINLDIKYRQIQDFSYYKKNFNLEKSPNSIKYFRQSFCLPMYVDLKNSELKKICIAINSTAKKLKL